MGCPRKRLEETPCEDGRGSRQYSKEVNPDGFLSLNVGGKPIDVRRSTLTYCDNSRLCALFSGWWEKALRRDADDRIFLDDNAKCFRKMITSLQQLKDSPAGQARKLPRMEEDQQPYFERMLEHYGVSGALGYPFVDFPSMMWIHKPLEAAGDELGNTLAQNVVLSISNQ